MKQQISNALWRQLRWHIVSFIAGIVVGVMFAGWLRAIVTILFFVGLVITIYFVWSYFEQLRKK